MEIHHHNGALSEELARFARARRRSRAVTVGPLTIGGDAPILVQSMTVSDTLNTNAVVAEVRELVEAGCPLVRLTAPSVRHAENLREIRRRLEADRIRVPMVADIHFTPNAALLAAEIVEKVRINPGNYADKKQFAVREYADHQYKEEVERTAERFRPLVRKLKAYGAALRIGTNHGSLSDRILNRFGDTPEGMVESALEFVRVCEDEGYKEIVLSMKSSVPAVMIAAYRLLAARMDVLEMDYPLHLGVTEAGDGLEGRIKSAVGIGALLADGLGDTIRVSLTEDARHEIPAARAILDALERERPSTALRIEATARPDGAAIRVPGPRPARRPTAPWGLPGLTIGGGAPIAVEERIPLPLQASSRPRAGSSRSDFLSLAANPALTGSTASLLSALDELRARRRAEGDARPVLLEWPDYRPHQIHVIEPALALVDGLSLSLDRSLIRDRIAAHEEKLRLLARLLSRRGRRLRWRLAADLGAPGAVARRLSDLCRQEGLAAVGFLCEPGPWWIARIRSVAEALGDSPDLLFLEAPADGADAPLKAGSTLNDGLGDSLCLLPGGVEWPSGGRPWVEDAVSSAFSLLQACRLRLTRAEFISCPSCGRTQFDLQSATERIRRRTQHLKGVKIAIMGCIVNGPGEMADADFGYVGSGPGKIDLYVGKERIRQGIREEEAADRLVELIREKGRWVEPAHTDGSVPTES